MPFSYGCFFSYRHRPDNRLNRAIVDGLYTALKDELDLYDVKVFRDEPEMQGGQLFPKKLSKALCESACLVVVYTPGYFSTDKLWCSQEYKAMYDLERKRLGALADAEEKTYGLILIVVFRGEENLYQDIKEERLYFDFSGFSLSDPEIPSNPLYTGKISEMASYIHQRLKVLRQQVPDPCADCAEFSMPTGEEVVSWLSQLESRRVAPRVKQQQSSDGPVNKFPLR